MRRAVGWVVVLGLLLVVAAGAWTASRGWIAYSALQDVRDEAPALVEAVTSGDPDAVAAASTRVRERTERARAATDDPLWRLAGRFPWGGENLQALTTTSTALDALADDGLPALQQVVTGVDDARGALSQGDLDLGALQSSLAGLDTVQGATDQARERLSRVQGDRLLPQVEQARDELLDSLDLAGQARTLLEDVRLPGLGALPGAVDGAVDGAVGRGGAWWDDLRSLPGDVVPDDVEGALADLASRAPDRLDLDRLPGPGSLREALPTAP